MLEISELFIHPIKSCRGISVSKACLGPTGFLFDRQFVVVQTDSKEGKFITGRTHPALALVIPSLPASLFDPSHAHPPDLAYDMTVQAPGMPDLKLDITSLVKGPTPRSQPLSEADLAPVTVWNWTGLGEDQGDEAAKWFSDYLQLPCRLVRYLGTGESNAIQQAERFTDPSWLVGKEVSFTDGFPLLFTHQASLDDLSKRAGEELSMRRFRPNVVLKSDAIPAWDEDEWLILNVQASVSKASVEFESCKPCTRCKFTTLNPETAVFGNEPLETLGTFRTGADLGWDQVSKSMKHEIVFGNNAVAKSIGEWISVGDAVQIVKRGRPTSLKPKLISPP